MLEGRKLWTFLPPSLELDAPLGTYRLAPNAFGSHNISAGWQSNVDLYQRAEKTREGGRICALWPSEGEGVEVMRHAVSGVQEQGELVLIPPRYWHQVCFLPPCCCRCAVFYVVFKLVVYGTVLHSKCVLSIVLH